MQVLRNRMQLSYNSFVSQQGDVVRAPEQCISYVMHLIFYSVYTCQFMSSHLNVTIVILDSIHRPVFYLKLLKSIGLSVPHRKHITSPLWAQQVNAIYRFVIIVH
jgi:hypothetical protein